MRENDKLQNDIERHPCVIVRLAWESLLEWQLVRENKEHTGTELENFTKGGENRKIQLHDWAIIQSNCQRQKAIDSLKILLEKSPEIKVMVKEKRE
jgi:hypothetical protein